MAWVFNARDMFKMPSERTSQYVIYTSYYVGRAVEPEMGYRLLQSVEVVEIFCFVRGE